MDAWGKVWYNDGVFCLAFSEQGKRMEVDWITPKQAAEKWGISDRKVQALCANEQIAGVVRLGLVWLIPKDAEKPK